MNQVKFENAFYNWIATKALKNKDIEGANNALAELLGNNTSVDEILGMNFSDFVESNANDVMATSEGWFWKEFVEQDVLIKELLDRVELGKNLLSKFNFKKMINGTQTIPVKGKKIRMRLTKETTDTNTSTAKLRRPNTAKMTITATELVVTIPYSDTFAEDSVINAVNFIMDSLYEAFETSLLEILLNGDTATTDNTNINIIDGSVTDLVEDDILGVDWLRKKAISKGSTLTAVWVLSIKDIRNGRKKMWIKWVKPSDIVYATDETSYLELIGLDEVNTLERFGNAFTIKNGILEKIDGSEIFPVEELGLSKDDGTISSDEANNTYGNILGIHVPSIEIYFRRVFTVETQRIAKERTTEVTGSTRVSIAINDVQNNKKPTSPAVLLTWITI